MVRIEQKDTRVEAYLSGDIDHHSAREMREEIDAALGRSHPKQLWMDFREVTFMDSSGIGLVMGRYKQMQQIGGELHVVNTSAHIKKVMKLAGLDRLAVLE